MMENPRSSSGNGDDISGIPDDLRCKRSDGKQWRCTALSMPDKTVCEKHYIQAKKRAANSAMRANMKKAKRNSLGEGDIYLESKSDDMDSSPLVTSKVGDYAVSVCEKYKEKVLMGRVSHSPELPSMMNMSVHNSLKSNEDLEMDDEQYEENVRSYNTPPFSAVESSKSRSQKNFDSSPMLEYSDGTSDSSDDTGGQPCHQCRQNGREVVWCLKCDRRGYCHSCLSICYSDIPLEEIHRVCPACRGACNCKACLKSDNFIKVKIREIPVKEKLEYLYSLLSAVLPVVKQIHIEQCSEVELERRLRGNEIDMARMKLNADEQMCCDLCRIPIIDYHRHCMNCSYDICLNCCQDLRGACTFDAKVKVEGDLTGRTDDKETPSEKVKSSKLKLLDKFSGWRANRDGCIPCPPKDYGGCGCSSLILKRIFKMNWVAKLVKNVEEMVNGCKINEAVSPQNDGLDFKVCQFANRENGDDNYLYCPSSEDIKAEGIGNFRKHWIKGEPVIVKEVMDMSSMSNWDPMAIWKGVREKDDTRNVKAVDCLEWAEIDIELGEFVKGYSEGRFRENGWPEMLKLKNWPSPSAFEEFLLNQRPEIISKLPLLEYIHSKWGLLNVAAKLPHYSLQNDVGPKVFISYGTYEELGRGDSVNNLHFKMRDMVYLLVHTCQAKIKGLKESKTEKMPNVFEESEAHKLPEVQLDSLSNDKSLKLLENENQDEHAGSLNLIKDEGTDDIDTSNADKKTITCEDLNGTSGEGVLDLIKDEIMDDIATSNADEKNVTCEDMKGTSGEGSLDLIKDGRMDEIATSNADEKNVTCEDMNGASGEDSLILIKDERMDDIATSNAGEKTITCEDLNGTSGDTCEKSCAGALWDVFRRQDVPKLIEYLKIHWKEFGKPDDLMDDSVPHRPLYDGMIFLTSDHKRKLKEELGVEPWSFEQNLGQAVFLPAGCPFQVRNLQSNVQLGLDFLSPESLGQAARLAEEIRSLPNDHAAKLQILEVGKISLYAASSAIKEVRKLVLDPNLGAELGFEDPNLTASVSQNLEKMIKQRQIACV